MSYSLTDLTIVIRGAGEMATGTAHRLHRAGFHRILMTEISAPLSVRRLVSFSEAVHDGSCIVEGSKAKLVTGIEEVEDLWSQGVIAVIVDPENKSRTKVRPDILVDTILAKKNLGTTIQDATLVVALGPGFDAGRDAHCVVETNRGHNLGRLIFEGPAEPNTGIPGTIAGETARRVLRAPVDGIFDSDSSIADMVETGMTVGYITGKPVKAGLSGVIRGLIRPNTYVNEGLKVGDIDPRGDTSYCCTISEKARAIGGAVLEAIMIRFSQTGRPGLRSK
ncbi:MAG: EF2563 family selenium-dependent molybdenum hydroxylase system protein [Desulfomonile tiedjei]|uniref:EF2563 family selenium-dependent molybdenum hydroxylase system protein n=1 Tax=Desulfomonile tiedjei TaxID=2358 RepID=A0A9D6V4W4_9BACT|nr:EF2563 family selenium-dependent molybdenum hydroxylase system protein [Desulfomonile tiedjei]